MSLCFCDGCDTGNSRQHSFTKAGTLYLDNFSWVTDVSWAVVKRGREEPAYFGRAICRYETKEANTGTLGCQRQDGRKAAWDGPSEGEYAVGLVYPVQVEASLLAVDRQQNGLRDSDRGLLIRHNTRLGPHCKFAAIV